MKPNTRVTLPDPSGRGAAVPSGPTSLAVEVRGRRRLRRADEDEIVRLYTAGRGSLDVAGQLGIGKTTVLNVLTRRGIEKRPHGKRIY